MKHPTTHGHGVYTAERQKLSWPDTIIGGGVFEDVLGLEDTF